MSELIGYEEDGTPVFKRGRYFYYGCSPVPLIEE